VPERLGNASIGIILDTLSHVLLSMQGGGRPGLHELFAPEGA
jgi:hypothetical protein